MGMTWIKVTDDLPPSDMSVLLYIVHLDQDKISIWNQLIIAGFYDEEKEKWACEYIEDDISYKYFNEMDNLKVVAWTLLPEMFDYEKYIKKRKELGLSLFRK